MHCFWSQESSSAISGYEKCQCTITQNNKRTQKNMQSSQEIWGQSGKQVLNSFSKTLEICHLPWGRLQFSEIAFGVWFYSLTLLQVCITLFFFFFSQHLPYAYYFLKDCNSWCGPDGYFITMLPFCTGVGQLPCY